MISPTDGFIVGSGGNIRRWNGTTWNSIVGGSGTTQNLNAVYCSSASNCFAVGASGVIVRSTGLVWSSYSPLPTPQNLNSISLPLPNDGWAVGGSGNILRLSGGGYETSGLLVSPAFDMGDPSPVQLIGWDESIPVCSPICSVKFNVRTAATSAGLLAVPWSLPSFTAALGTLIDPSHNGGRFAQYRVQLTGDGVSTPILQEVRINYK